MSSILLIRFWHGEPRQPFRLRSTNTNAGLSGARIVVSPRGKQANARDNIGCLADTAALNRSRMTLT